MFAIEAKNLTKYYGKSRGIVDVDLQVNEGEIFGFIGPNGAGKSTTIRILLNFIFPYSGSASVFGLDVVNHAREIRAQVGYLPGEVDYYDEMTAGELLAYSAHFYRANHKQRIKELVDIFELDTKKKIHSLSLGNKKKVAIIQALLHQPRLLILDEPTGGLDPLMQKRFFSLLREEHARGTTIFFSSHILSEVQKLCQRVAIIRDGRIVALEDVAKLRENQFRKIRVSFQGPVPELDIPGIVSRQQENGSLTIFFNGDINQLIQALSAHRLQNLWLEEPTLEEIFMHYYETEEN